MSERPRVPGRRVERLTFTEDQREPEAEAQQRGTGTTIQDVLSERGYDCGWVEYQESQGR
jgi:hypothetical protein